MTHAAANSEIIITDALIARQSAIDENVPENIRYYEGKTAEDFTAEGVAVALWKAIKRRDEVAPVLEVDGELKTAFDACTVKVNKVLGLGDQNEH